MAEIKISKNLELTSVNRRAIKHYDTLPQAKKEELKKLESTCRDFESIFVYQIMKEMRKTVHKTGLVSGGWAEDVFSDMLDQERAKGAALGLGDLLFAQLAQAIVPPKRK